MRAEILTIGDEICRGEIVDTNATWLSAALWDMGYEVAWRTTCRDVAVDIAAAMRQAAGRADVVLCTGGLGPTEDDLTVDVACGLLGCEAVVDEIAAARMRAKFAGTGRADTPLMMRQVRRPVSADSYVNPVGLAPGFAFRLADATVICFPGPPAELHGIFEAGVRAWLLARAQAPDAQGHSRVGVTLSYRTFGLGESQVSSLCRDIAPRFAGFSVHYQLKFPETLVTFVQRGVASESTQEVAAQLDHQVQQQLGFWCYGGGREALPALCARLLAAHGQTVATAESCTGGMLAMLLTDMAGASALFPGGVVAYANEQKTRLLGVATELLATHGAVSEACVVAMAAAARAQFHSGLGLAISGVAGPDGGRDQLPVGTVWLALAHAGGVQTRRIWFPGTRAQVRLLAAWWGLRMIVAHLRQEPLP